MGKENPYLIKSVMRAFRILEIIEEQDSVQMSEVTSELDISRPAVHKHLKTLKELDLIIQDEDGYQPKKGLTSHTSRASTRWKLFEAAQSAVDNLEQNTRGTVCFIVAEQDEAVYLYVSGPGKWADSLEGCRTRLQEDTGGRAILACNPELRQKIGGQHIDEEIQAIEETGYVTGQDTRYNNGFKMIAAPIRDETGTAVSAIGIAGTFDWIADEQLEKEVISPLLSITKNIEQNLHSGFQQNS